MATFTELLDAPVGTIATTLRDGTPWTAVIVEQDGERRLRPQHDRVMIRTEHLRDVLSQYRDEAGEVMQVHPTRGQLLPRRRVVRHHEASFDASQRQMIDALAPLPIGAVVDVTGASLAEPSGIEVITRVSEAEWAPLLAHTLTYGLTVDRLRAAVASSPGVTPGNGGWVQAYIVDPLRGADFTVVPELASWAPRAVSA